MNAVRHFLLALQFFTRIPVTGAVAQWVGYSAAMLRASAAHFPGIGLLVGAVAAIVYAALATALPQGIWSPLVAAALSTAATVLVTGGFHEDGLADLADGLGGSTQRERAMEIMKDSRIGSFGALALVLAIGSKLALLALLGSAGLAIACGGILLAHTWSRLMPLLVISLLPHVGDTLHSKSKPLADRIGGMGLLAGSCWALLALGISAALLAPAAVAAGVIAAVAGFLWMWRLLARRLQGFTGDGLGATQQVCELACYLGVAVTL